MFKKGDRVRVKAVVPEGPVIVMRMSEEGVVSYLIEWTDSDEVVHRRWFDEDQLMGV